MDRARKVIAGRFQAGLPTADQWAAHLRTSDGIIQALSDAGYEIVKKEK